MSSPPPNRISLFRRIVTTTAFTVAIILTIVGCQKCDYKIVPTIRLALWFPLPYLLGAYSIPGILLSLIQFPLLAGVFALAIRRWRVRWVLATFVGIYALYAFMVITKLGPPR